MKIKSRWLLIVVLLLGVALRWSQLDVLSGMLNTDEAANGLDALSLIESPRLTPFFPSYTGRESGWHYWLVPFLLVFGMRPLAIRLAATVMGILTLSAVYALGCELLPRRAALWSAAALAVLYWHVQLSQLGFRAIMYPFIGALALRAVLHAHRTNRLSAWVGTGIGLGLLAYTYFSARVWLGYVGIYLFYWLLFQSDKRRGILLAACITLILVLPLFTYTLFNPIESFSRMGEVRVFDLAGIAHNAWAWGRAWFYVGDQNVMLNLPGKPILDVFLAIPFVVGGIALWWMSEKHWLFWWLLGLAGVSIVPSLLSDHAPHFLRAIGLVVPVALTIGNGLAVLERLLQRYVGRLAMVLPCILVCLTGLNTYVQLNSQWLHHPDLPMQMEWGINEAVSSVVNAYPTGTPLYFTPVLRANPTLMFWDAALGSHYVAAFDHQECWVKPERPAVYVFVEEQSPQMALLTSWADVQSSLSPDPTLLGGRAVYAHIFAVKPDVPSWENGAVATFAEDLQVSLAAPLPKQVHPGDTLDIALDFQTQYPISALYSVFVHLYGTPSPYEGGVIWSQVDRPLCVSYPMSQWQSFERINQAFLLDLPDDLPLGVYDIVMGVYAPDTGVRLPVTEPVLNEWDHFALGQISVE